MISDYFTKPLQGSLFRRLRDFIMNVPSGYGPSSIQVTDHRSVLNENDRSGTEGQTGGSATKQNTVENK